jgi:hypothetical protein
VCPAAWGGGTLFYYIYAMNQKEYKTYLQTNHWKQFRRKTVTNKCWNCGMGGKMNLHHTTYDNLYHETFMDVITLCEGCHHAVHKLIKSGTQKLATAHFFLKGLPIPSTKKTKGNKNKAVIAQNRKAQRRKKLRKSIKKYGKLNLSRKDRRDIKSWYNAHPNWK